jgi:hypothetical protein
MTMPSAEKIDLCKIHKNQYAAPKSPILVTVDEAAYLSIDGRGAPGGPEFKDKVGVLYAVAYTVKMTRKFDGLQDYVICKLEALWWLDDPKQTFETAPQEAWNWKLMIRTPDFVEPDELQRAATTLIEKGKTTQTRQVRLERLAEGRCVQMLHVGLYETEGQTFEQMKAFAHDKGLAFHGRPHDVYLSDPRRVPPERLQTILRHPVREA